MSKEDSQNVTGLLTRTERRVEEPPLFKVVLLNDDFTPMDFVVQLIMRFFSKSEAEATRIMLSIHHQGAGVCGTYPRDTAETKAMQVNRFAREHNHPLKCVTEKA